MLFVTTIFASGMGKKDNAIFLDCNTLDFEYAPIVLDGAKIVVLINRMLASLTCNLILYSILMSLKLLICQVSESLDITYCL